MTQGRQPQQTAESFFQLNACETRADPFPALGPEDIRMLACRPICVKTSQDPPPASLRTVALLGQRREAPSLHSSGACPPLAVFSLGPGSRARDEEDEKTCDYAEDPVSCVSGDVDSTPYVLPVI